MSRLKKREHLARGLIRLSERAVRTGEPAINRLMSQALAEADLISLAAGFVDYETLPVAETRAALAELLSDEARARAALQYGTTEGLVRLRERLATRMARADGHALGTRGYDVENVLVGTGSQQLLYLLTEVLLDPGDIVILGHPSYFVFMDALRSSGVSCRTVPLDENGIQTDLLRDLFEDLSTRDELDRVKMIYLVSYFQNPTGISLSATRRREVLELVREFSPTHRIHIVEDTAYRELRYDGEDVPSIRSHDEDGGTVICLGTFSKPFSPGLKTGYGLFPPGLATQVAYVKGAHDFGSSNFTQHLFDTVLEMGLFDSHAKQLRESYRKRRDVMVSALDKKMPEGVGRTHPHGGLYVWLTLPEGMPTGPDSRLFKSVLEKGMIYVPGEFCFAADPDRETPPNCIRLSFGVGTLEKIAEGVTRLAEAVKECLP